MRGICTHACLLLSFALLAACASTPPSQVPTSGPPQWVAAVDWSQTECEDIVGAFQNLGERYEPGGRVNQDGLLAEQVFLRNLSRREVARSVAIDSDIRAGWLDATLVGTLALKIGFAVSCRDGWHLFVETQTTRSLADEVLSGQFEHTAYFRLDRRGRLIARVLSDSTYRTDITTVTRESSENWYRFESVD